MPTQLDVESRAQEAQQTIVELARKLLSPTRMIVGQIKSVADVASGFVQVRIEDANTNVGIGGHASSTIVVDDYWLVAQDTYTNRHTLIYKLADSAGNPEEPIATSLSLNKVSTITLNADQTGTPAATDIAQIIVERGNSPDVRIKWNEADDILEFHLSDTDSLSTRLAILDSDGTQLIKVNTRGQMTWNTFPTIIAGSGSGINLKLGDTAGATFVAISDLGGALHASIDSDGDISSDTHVRSKGFYIYGLPFTEYDLEGGLEYVALDDIRLFADGGTLRIDASANQDIHVKLGDAAGTQKLKIRDSGDADVLTIDSNGVLTLFGSAGAYLVIEDTGYYTNIRTLEIGPQRDIAISPPAAGELRIFGNQTTTGTIYGGHIKIPKGKTMTLNWNETTTPTQNAEIVVERGSGADSSIRWNETLDRWEFYVAGTLEGYVDATGFVST